MKVIIPPFILKKYERGQLSGSLRAASLFADLSGFTPLGRHLMLYKKDGAEILSAILETLFPPIIDYVQSHGGIITSFAGDAFTALFQKRVKDAALHAVQCAFFMRNHIEKHRPFRTKYGDFDVGIKVGLSFGHVSWGIVKSGAGATYFFRGDAISDAVQAESQAEPGDIIADKEFLPLVRNFITSVPCLSSGKLIESKLDLPKKRKSAVKTNVTLQDHFIAGDVIHLKLDSEFRNVCSIFLSFDVHEKKSVMNRFIAQVIDLVARYGLYFNKLDFGDKGGLILILVGAPVAFERNVERALEFINNFRQEHEKGPIKWRCGLTYGQVFTGFVGSEKACDYTAMGDSVNLAARLVIKSPWREIWLAERVRRYAFEEYNCVYLDHYKFKGFERPLSTFRLQGKKIQTLQKFSYSFVGRSKELKKIEDFIKPIFDNSFAGILYVYGEAGIGKSRLVFTLREKLAQQVKWFSCQANEIHKYSFAPFIHWLKTYFQQNPRDTVAEKKRRFELHHDELMHDLRELETIKEYRELTSELKRTKTILATLIGLNYEGSLWDTLDAKGKNENMLIAFRTLFIAESLLKPVIIELDDFQWFDHDSRALIQSLVPYCLNCPVAIIATARQHEDGTVAELKLEAQWQKQLVLHALNDDELWHMAHQISRGKFKKDHFAVLKRCNGNPFFLEQMVLYLIDEDSVEMERVDAVESSQELSLAMPESIHSLMIARLDRLHVDLKKIVQTASAVGVEYDSKFLWSVLTDLGLGYPLAEFYNWLIVAEQKQIWNLIEGLKYLFCHSLFRDAVYEIQMGEHLKNVHQIIAQAFERAASDKTQYCYELVYHYQRAENQTKLIEYLEIAARHAENQYHNETALTFYQKLIEILPPDETERSVKIRNQYGLVLEKVGRWDEAQQNFERAIKMAEHSNDLCDLGESCRLLGGILNSKGQFSEAMKLTNEALQIFQGLSDSMGISRSLNGKANIYVNQGLYEEASQCYVKTMELLSGSSNDQQRCVLFCNMCVVCYYQKNYKTAMEYATKALELALKVDDKMIIAAASGNMGIILNAEEKYEDALQCFQRTLKISEELGNQWSINYALANMGILHLSCGNVRKAQKLFEHLLTRVEPIDDQRSISVALQGLGNCYMNQGDFEKSRKFFRQDLALALSYGDKLRLSAVYGLIGGNYYYQGEYSEALDYYKSALDIALELHNGHSIIQWGLQRIKAMYELGKYQQAAVALEKIKNCVMDAAEGSKTYEIQIMEFKLKALENKAEGISGLHRVLNKVEHPSLQAEIHLELYYLTDSTENLNRAFQYYQGICNRYPTFENKYYLNKLKSLINEGKGIR